MSGHDAICYSGATQSVTKHKLGSLHYSYRFAEEKFLQCFEAMSLDKHFLAMPEYYSAPRSYLDLPTYRGRHIHVIFRSTESIRLLKEGYNVACFAWEFPYLKSSSADGEHPFENQKRMLELCDEIWVPCSYTKQILEQHDIGNVHWVPAPIAIDAVPKLRREEARQRLGHIDAKTFHVNFLGMNGVRRGDDYLPLFSALQNAKALHKKIYLAIFNPEDFRKNLDALVHGFDRFQQRHGDAVLLIKALTSVERFTLDRVVHDVMVNKLSSGSSFANDNIVVFNQFLSDEEMTALYDLADFYLCTSIAEGQNLPLLEAMARGVVPVTTRNTAMLDYIDPSNAVIIDTDRQLNQNKHLAGNVAGKPYFVELCDARQVATALHASAALDANAYAERSRRARDKVVATFSHERVGTLVAARLRDIAGERTPSAGTAPSDKAGARSTLQRLTRRG